MTIVTVCRYKLTTMYADMTRVDASSCIQDSTGVLVDLLQLVKSAFCPVRCEVSVTHMIVRQGVQIHCAGGPVRQRNGISLAALLEGDGYLLLQRHLCESTTSCSYRRDFWMIATFMEMIRVCRKRIHELFTIDKRNR